MKALEIFIGLFFVYLVLSTLVTAISEILISYRNVRAKVLRKSIRRMLANNLDLEAAFFDTAEIKSLIDQTRLDKAQAKPSKVDMAAPSYLEGETFARNLIKILSKESSPVLSLDTFSHSIEKWMLDESAHGERSDREQLVQVLNARIEEAVTLQKKTPGLEDRECLIRSIKQWYDDSMERSRGIYRRATRWYVIGSACVLTLLLNADTIRIVRSLSTDQAALSATVKASQDAVGSRLEQLDDQSPENVEGLQNAVQKLEEATYTLEEVGVPLGWDSYEYPKFKESWTRSREAPDGKSSDAGEDAGGDVPNAAGKKDEAAGTGCGVLGWFLFFKAIGLLATAIAATLGAPFWYDILNKLSNLRGSVGLSSKKEPSVGANAGGDSDDTAAGAGVSMKTKAAKSLKLSFADEGEGFDIDRAYWLGRCATASYLPFAEIKTTVSTWGLRDSVTTIGTDSGGVTGTQGFVACNSDCIVIAFRGTEKKSDDILTDVDLLQDKWPISTDSGDRVLSVHGGFLEGYLNVKEQVMQVVQQLLEENPKRSIWLTGHSLGGALATVCLADLLSRKIPVSGVYTFGSPRVGNRAFVDYLNQSAKEVIFRFVNEDDPVTEVPLEAIQDYCHVGNLKYLDRFNRLKEDAATWKRVLRKTAFWLDLKYDSDSKNEAMERLKREFKQRASYHSMDNYNEKIAAHSGHRTQS